jgi:hypothetical protein
MTTKQRLRDLRAECPDWELIVARFTLDGGMSKQDVELAILSLVDAGLVQIEPRPNGFTAFRLTLPEGIPEEVLSHA